MPGDDLLLSVTALAAIGVAVLTGPLMLTCRAVLRRLMPPAALRRWQGPVTAGVGAGLLAATLLGATTGGNAALVVAVFGLLLLLATLDLAWRWLPFAWTMPLLALGIVAAWVNHALIDAILGVALGAGVLLALQLSFRFLRGVEALGTGDIWLAAGLGALAGPQKIMLILGLSAVLALAVEAGRSILVTRPGRRRLGVAYGAHMCLAYIVFVPL